MTVTTSTMTDLRDSVATFLDFFAGPIWARNGQPGMANFAVGNPQEMPLPAYVDALRSHLEPQSPDWFAYKISEPRSQATVARGLTARTGLDWDPADVAMTNGGFAALAVAFRTILEPGDEVIFLSPPWWFYELLIRAAGGVPIRVPPAAVQALTAEQFENEESAEIVQLTWAAARRLIEGQAGEFES